MTEFVLNLAENPHPKMLAGALEHRKAAEQTRGWPSIGNAYTRGEWAGYLAAMCDATGETAEAIEAWMDRHQ